MESVYARIYEPELFYAAQEPPPCRLSKEDLSKTPFKNTFEKQRPKRIKPDPSTILKPNSKKAFKTPFQKHLSKTEPI
jgi:hypothetical protein